MEEDIKPVSVRFDKYSKEILKKVDAIHRESMINLGLALVSKTGYYKTLCGISEDKGLGAVVDIGVENIEALDNTEDKSVKVSKPSTPQQSSPKAKAASWDDF